MNNFLILDEHVPYWAISASYENQQKFYAAFSDDLRKQKQATCVRIYQNIFKLEF